MILNFKKKKQEIEEQQPRTCGFCQKRFPEGQPIPVVLPPQGRILAGQPQIQALPMCVCHNPDSPRYNQMMYVEGTCECHIPIEVKKKDETGVINDGEKENR